MISKGNHGRFLLLPVSEEAKDEFFFLQLIVKQFLVFTMLVPKQMCSVERSQ